MSVVNHWEENAESWTQQVRAGFDVYRDALNTPAFLALLPDVKGQSGLDIGCGEGTNTRAVAQRGARMTGVDIAPTFIRHAIEAEEADPLGIGYQVADAGRLPFDDESFDFCTSFMAMMDIADQKSALAECWRVLKPGGFFQFSILHPCFVPPFRKVLRDDDGTVRGVELARYFEATDGTVETWWFSTVPRAARATIEPFRMLRFHRTLSDWVAMIVASKFSIVAMQEPMATEDLAKQVPTVADTRVVPLFLHLQLRKS